MLYIRGVEEITADNFPDKISKKRQLKFML